MSSINIPINFVHRDESGAIIPNPLFHRPFNKLHSRCVEYPFAASMLVSKNTILDLGSARADKHWLAMLKNFPADVIFFDHDPPQSLEIPLVLGDCRHMPFADQSFDLIIAVSLIEHIGLLTPQTIDHKNRPSYSLDGDIETLWECRRVLKKFGKLVLTVPMGIRRGYSPDASARVYSFEDIKRFSKVLHPMLLDYYEYQVIKGKKYLPASQSNTYGMATWRRIDIHQASALNFLNMDGILCSTWIKNRQ